MAKIETVFSAKDEMSATLRSIQKSIGGLESELGGLNKLARNVASGALAFKMAQKAVGFYNNTMRESSALYAVQIQNETKLETIMRQRMGATDGQIQEMKDYASQLQKAGIYGDEMLLSGMQELATYTNSTKALKNLTPALADLVAQQYGYNASAEQMRTAGTMLGKVLQGQTGALTRWGYIFSEEEEKMIKFGDDQQRAAAVSKIITENVGHMNAELAKTPVGQARQMANEIGDIKERIGATSQGLTVLKSKVELSFWKAMENIIKQINGKIRDLTPVIEKLAAQIEKIDLEKIMGMLPLIMGALAAPKAIGTINSISKALPVLSKGFASLGGAGVSALGAAGILGALGAVGIGLIALAKRVADTRREFKRMIADASMGGVVYNEKTGGYEFTGVTEERLSMLDRAGLQNVRQAVHNKRQKVMSLYGIDTPELLGAIEKSIKTNGMGLSEQEMKLISGYKAAMDAGGHTELFENAFKELKELINVDKLVTNAELKLDNPKDLSEDENTKAVIENTNATKDLSDIFKERLARAAMDKFKTSFSSITPTVNKGADLDKIADFVEEAAAQKAGAA